MKPLPQVYLASASARRAALLQQIGVRFETLSVEVAEHCLAGEGVADYVARLALAKARAGWRGLGTAPRAPVLGADTAIGLEGDILGKPRDRAEGIRMLERLCGRTHQVYSAVAVVSRERAAVRTQVSEVRFRRLSRAECEAYWQTGEPRDKAGSYAIQGLAAIFIERLEGSYSGVMGLPLYETADLLSEFGVEILTTQ